MKGINCVAAPLAIGGGVMDIGEGASMIERGDAPDGAVKVGEGVATTSSGVAGLAGLVSGAGATLAPALGSFAMGMEIGHYGDEEAKKLGVFHDSQQRADSASDWASEEGFAADQYVSQKFHSKGLGTAAGAVTTGLSSIAGGVAAGAGAVAGAAQKLWDWL